MKRPSDPWLPPLSDREFERLRTLIQREAGIHLGEQKRALLVGRLQKRLRDLELDTFAQYYDYVTAGHDQELVQLLDCICTNETHFFREPDHWTFLAERGLPELAGLAAAGRIEKRLRVWSAACSTGEEPYSLAMLLSDHFPRSSGWRVDILASDLSTKVLDKARAATWPIDKVTEIPPSYLSRFMLRGTGSQSGNMRACAALRSMVRCERINLNHERYPISGQLDLIFCRNVLIYFDTAEKTKVVRRLLQRLAPHGYLFLGHAETLAGIADDVESVAPNVYRLRTLKLRVPAKPWVSGHGVAGGSS